MKPDRQDIPDGALVFNLAPNSGEKQPAFPVLPDDLKEVDLEALADVASSMPMFLMVYVENDQPEEAKALVALMRRVAKFILAERDEALATCTCPDCTAARAGSAEATATIAKAKGGETLH